MCVLIRTRAQECKACQIRQRAHWSTSARRSSTAVEPSRRRKDSCRWSRTLSRTSSMDVHWEKISALWPSACKRGACIKGADVPCTVPAWRFTAGRAVPLWRSTCSRGVACHQES